MKKEKLPALSEGHKDYRKAGWLEVFCASAVFFVFSSLAFLAFTRQDIYLGNPRSAQVSHYTGPHAIAVGIGLMTLGFIAIGYVGRRRKYTLLFWFFLACAWLGVVAWEIAAGF